MDNKNLLDILAVPPAERTAEQRLTLLEHDFEELQRENHMLRVSLTGAMNLSRQIEKHYIEIDKMVSWHHKVINQNYSKFINS